MTLSPPSNPVPSLVARLHRTSEVGLLRELVQLLLNLFQFLRKLIAIVEEHLQPLLPVSSAPDQLSRSVSMAIQEPRSINA
jgi:hypothetical protein